MKRQNPFRHGCAPLPEPMVQDNSWVVLTSDQWASVPMIESRNAVYAPVYSEMYGRHVVIQDTLGM